MAKKILIVDDSSFVRESLKAICEKAGYKVVGVTGEGKDAIRLYMELMPDLVLLDVQMEPMNGLLVLEQIRKSDPKAKVLMVTVIAHKTTKETAISLGAAGYVMKPYTEPEIKHEIERIIGKPYQ